MPRYLVIAFLEMIIPELIPALYEMLGCKARYVLHESYPHQQTEIEYLCDLLGGYRPPAARGCTW